MTYLPAPSASWPRHFGTRSHDLHTLCLKIAHLPPINPPRPTKYGKQQLSLPRIPESGDASSKTAWTCPYGGSRLTLWSVVLLSRHPRPCQPFPPPVLIMPLLVMRQAKLKVPTGYSLNIWLTTTAIPPSGHLCNRSHRRWPASGLTPTRRCSMSAYYRPHTTPQGRT